LHVPVVSEKPHYNKPRVYKESKIPMKGEFIISTLIELKKKQNQDRIRKVNTSVGCLFNTSLNICVLMRGYYNLLKSTNGVNRLNSNIVQQTKMWWNCDSPEAIIKYSCHVSDVFSHLVS